MNTDSFHSTEPAGVETVPGCDCGALCKDDGRRCRYAAAHGAEASKSAGLERGDERALSDKDRASPVAITHFLVRSVARVEHLLATNAPLARVLEEAAVARVRLRALDGALWVAMARGSQSQGQHR